MGWALSAPREVERSIGIRQLSYSTLVVVLSSRSLYSKFVFLHTQAINIGMKFLSPWEERHFSKVTKGVQLCQMKKGT